MSSTVRWFAGIYVASDCRRIEAAMIGIHGRGHGAAIESRKCMSFDLPPEIMEGYSNLLMIQQHPQSVEVGLDELWTTLVYELSSLVEEAIEELIVESGIPQQEVLAVGVLDPGLWDKSDLGKTFRPLTSSELLAERTGLNIIDAFPSRDLASGGQGGPLLPFPSWIVLCNESTDRLLLDLGKTARLTYLPRPLQPNDYERIDYWNIVPCGGFLDALTLKLTKGKTEVDMGGHLTVQGKHIPELLEIWRKLLLSQPRSEWSPLGLSPSPFLESAFEKATVKKWAIRDIACTAAHFIAESVGDKVLQHVQSGKTEILLSGGGSRHGLLLNQLKKRLGDCPFLLLRDCGIPLETSVSFDAVGVAILTLFFADQIPSGIQRITGAETAKPLGRLTPGSPQSWAHLLDDLIQSKPIPRTLRSSVTF